MEIFLYCTCNDVMPCLKNLMCDISLSPENENFDAMDGIGNTTFPVNLEQASNHVITETSSANKNQGHLSSKPKKGFLRRLNSAISRVFLSKL